MITENYCLGCDIILFCRVPMLQRIIGMYLKMTWCHIAENRRVYIDVVEESPYTILE